MSSLKELRDSLGLDVRRRYFPWQIVIGGLGMMLLGFSLTCFVEPERRDAAILLLIWAAPYLALGWFSGVICIAIRTPPANILATLILFTLKCLAFVPTLIAAMVLWLFSFCFWFRPFTWLGPLCATNKSHYTLYKDGKKEPFIMY